ncbi:MAG: NADH-quinone oxidoreductase subunit NuoK [Vulcanimicrobiaceae bacterium]
MNVPLQLVLIFAGGLFAIGLWGVLTQRALVMIIMALEVMLIGATVEVMAFWRYLDPTNIDPHVFAIVILTIASVEEAMGLGIALMLYRRSATQNVDRFTELRG